MLKRDRLRQTHGPKGPYYADTRIGPPTFVEDFGMQWREFDPYPRLQQLSYAHLFARFLLRRTFFQDKVVVDLGCGNGRIGRFIIPDASRYVGVELSDAITAFEVPPEAQGRVDLIQASIEDVPVDDHTADVVLCWGVLHHVQNPPVAISEMRRIVKPGGTLLIYVYPDAFAERENLNRLLKHVDAADFRDFCTWFLNEMRLWATTDDALATGVCAAMCASRKPHPEWELIQMFDGLGPEYHHQLEQTIPLRFAAPWRVAATHYGCFVIEAPANA